MPPHRGLHPRALPCQAQPFDVATRWTPCRRSSRALSEMEGCTWPGLLDSKRSSSPLTLGHDILWTLQFLTRCLSKDLGGWVAHHMAKVECRYPIDSPIDSHSSVTCFCWSKAHWLPGLDMVRFSRHVKPHGFLNVICRLSAFAVPQSRPADRLRWISC